MNIVIDFPRYKEYKGLPMRLNVMRFLASLSARNKKYAFIEGFETKNDAIIYLKNLGLDNVIGIIHKYKIEFNITYYAIIILHSNEDIINQMKRDFDYEEIPYKILEVNNGLEG